jgi:hypothetical protein
MTDKPRRRFQFSLRTLLVVITVLSGGLWWLSSQMAGELQRESEISGAQIQTGALPTLSFSCATARDATSLAERFDKTAFLKFGVQMRNPIFLDHGTFGNVFFVKYDFDEWGRYRLVLPYFRYEFDANDPVARERNGVVHRAMAEAGRRYASGHARVKKYEHFP